MQEWGSTIMNNSLFQVAMPDAEEELGLEWHTHQSSFDDNQLQTQSVCHASPTTEALTHGTMEKPLPLPLSLPHVVSTTATPLPPFDDVSSFMMPSGFQACTAEVRVSSTTMVSRITRPTGAFPTGVWSL